LHPLAIPIYALAMDQSLPATEITALLGRGTRFEGKLHFEGRVRIDGVFKGEIKSDDTLIIGDGAEVHAEVECSTVIVRGGIVHGNVRARQSLELHAPAKLVGNIQSPSIFIDRGVEFQGSCRMDALDGATATRAPTAEAPANGPRAEAKAAAKEQARA
jgi:cytoskeletal protein CcmA (bactofilin family)